MKYVRTSHSGFFIWPENTSVTHRDIGIAVGRKFIISAGFCSIDGETESVICYGRSESLDIDSNKDDFLLLKLQLFNS